MKVRKKMFCFVIVVVLAVAQVMGIGYTEPALAKAKPALNRTKISLRVGGRTVLKLSRWKKRVKWSSSKKSVATVSQKGVVRAKRKGSAKITAKAGRKKYVCRVTVKAKKTIAKQNDVNKTRVDVQPAPVSNYASEVLSLVNQERQKYGLPGLVLDQKLCGAADQRAKEIASLFSHTRPDGTDCFTVLNEFGISFRACGENIAAGYTTAQEVVDGWMSSPGHRANILSNKFGSLGVGCVSSGKPYWVQLFTDAGTTGQPAPAGPSMPPQPTALAPTNAPAETSAPTNIPDATEAPTNVPTETPTDVPDATLEPTNAPVGTSAPTNIPDATEAPTSVPAETSAPTNAPAETSAPTNIPDATEAPTSVPTDAPAAPTEEPGSTPDVTDSYAQQVLDLVNVERAKEGLGALALDETLCAAADLRAEETGQVFSHTRPDGTKCFTVLEQFGIQCNTAGENIAAGYPTAAAVVDGWMNSEGHRANILSPSFHKLGVGFAEVDDQYGYYWTQLFTD